MKLFQTKRPLCAYSVSLVRSDSAVQITFDHYDGAGALSLSIDANNFMDSLPLGQREKADRLNLYLSVTADRRLRVVNKFAETYYSKADGMTYWAQLQEPILGQIYIPFANATIDEMALRFNTRNDIVFDPAAFDFRGEVEHTSEAFGNVGTECLPNLRVAEVEEADGIYTVTAQVTLNNADVAREGVRLFAQSASGYIPVREATTDANGRATFQAQRLLLAPTDPMVMEIGTKFCTNLVSVPIGDHA